MARGIEMVENYSVVAKFDGTADDVLRAAGFSRTMVTGLRKEEGLIRVISEKDGAEKTVFVTARVYKGDKINVSLPVFPVLYPASDLKPEFRYADEDIAVVVKPSGVATVPVKSHYKDSLASILGAEWGEFVYRPVGRLDKDTSGLIAVARNALSACRMHELQLSGGIEKKYTALVSGLMPESGEIDAPIALSSDGIRREAADGGKPAKTLFRRIGTINGDSLVEFTLLTGRTHQIRVHTAYIGHPIVGDKLYGDGKDGATRLMLHCSRLAFPHPTTGRTVEAEDPFVIEGYRKTF